jgi:hypothetical protein
LDRTTQLTVAALVDEGANGGARVGVEELQALVGGVAGDTDGGADAVQAVVEVDVHVAVVQGLASMHHAGVPLQRQGLVGGGVDGHGRAGGVKGHGGGGAGAVLGGVGQLVGVHVLDAGFLGLREAVVLQVRLEGVDGHGVGVGAALAGGCVLTAVEKGNTRAIKNIIIKIKKFRELLIAIKNSEAL